MRKPTRASMLKWLNKHEEKVRYYESFEDILADSKMVKEAKKELAIIARLKELVEE